MVIATVATLQFCARDSLGIAAMQTPDAARGSFETYSERSTDIKNKVKLSKSKHQLKRKHFKHMISNILGFLKFL